MNQIQRNIRALNVRQMRPAGQHEGSWMIGRVALPKIQNYADAIAVLISNKVSGPLRRLARRAIALWSPTKEQPRKPASLWLVENVRGWSKRKLVKIFRRTVKKMARGYCPVPARFDTPAEERLKCFTVLAEEIKRRARECSTEAVATRQAAHNAAMVRPDTRGK